MRHFAASIATLTMIAACAPQAGTELPDLANPAISYDRAGACYATHVAPAVIETVTVQEIETPAVLGEDGTIITPATYRSQSRQQILRERGEITFETVCPPVFTEEFVQTLQRALAARGFYRGAIDGQLSTATGRAIQDFQQADGPDSPLLSMAAAQKLGIMRLTREQIDKL